MQRSLKIGNKLVFNKIRERLGGRLKVAASGAAPLSRDLAQFFEAIGMPLIEGYGLTEGGVATLNPIDAARPGSIGKVLPGVEVKIAADGERSRAPVCFRAITKIRRRPLRC
jgi:long-chain acyl-CoA synthetase